MTSEGPAWDYVFVSDLHLSQGYDQDRRAYHPREDFFFDDVFFRWLRWLNSECADDRRWELVFAGDALDFLPVDERTVSDYLRERDRRRKALDVGEEGELVRYWEQQFAAVAMSERVPERIQRLIFEDDVLDGRIVLESAVGDGLSARASGDVPVPAWALELYARYSPDATGGGAPDLTSEWRVRVPRHPGPPRYDGTRGSPPSGDQAGQGSAPKLTERRRDEEFERRYGFLPTPEKSTQKLDAIYRGHPTFFRALAWLVGHGHRVVFLRGNHDLELYWPSVQERFRSYVAREYAAAFADASGYSPDDPPSPSLDERVVFLPGWFYYRPGAFYAEHGCQYDMVCGSTNPIRPLLPGNPWLLNPDVGSFGVICLHNHLETQFPELENEANYAARFIGIIRREPFRMGWMLVRRATDFVRMASRLWLAGQAAASEQEPDEGDLAYYGGLAGLEPIAVRSVYEGGSKPLLLRERLAWLLFSPRGHVIKALGLAVLAAIVICLSALWFLVLAPAVAGLLPASLFVTTVVPTLRILANILLWLGPPAAYAWLRRKLSKQLLDDPLFEASARIHRLLRAGDPGLRHIVMGHSHLTDVRPIAMRADGRHIYYLNTGTWTPAFAEGKRRLQTLGREVQFTFLQIVNGPRGYESELLRWDDSAGRADPQMVPPDEA